MPIFEYHCNDCKTEFEVLARIGNAEKLPKCPSCGVQDTKKRFSAFATARTQKESASDNAT
ncbi:zinc ribbon domain-containing protein [Candidatus Poribacteria bacterium]|nr:zinc ribbon domain-containing protein [Candidatus Poribacteria bacterium]MYB00721.1 zinc ribbon domain-containing protein [Candidatus Poribacteria bacterium]